MLIAVDISPISSKSNSGHKVRGVGKYIELLYQNLPLYDKENKYIFIEDNNIPENADLIHYPYFDPFFVTLPFKKRKTTLVTIHDLIPLMHRKNFPIGIRGEIKWQVNKMLLRRIDGIIVDSNASGEDAHKLLGISKNRIFTVYLAVDKVYESTNDINVKKNIIEKYDLPEKFFLYVGDVTWNKNLPRLISAIEKVNMPLVMVGKALVEEDFDNENPWNNDRNEVNKRTSNNSLFMKLGFVPNEDLNVIYNLAIALCMPSLDEGFGLPILEAMDSGCPVITSRFGSLEEVGGDAVFYIDPADIDNMALGLEKISNDAKLRNELKEKGISQAKKFSLRKMVEDTVSVYEQFA